MNVLVQEVDAILATLPEGVRQGLLAPTALQRLHAKFELQTSRATARLAEVLEDSDFLPGPELMRMFVTTAELLDRDTIAVWLVGRAAEVGASPAVAELMSYSKMTAFAAREVMVLDGVRVGQRLELENSVSLERLTLLQPTSFRDQFGDTPTPWQAPRDRAALVRTLDHPVILKRPDDCMPSSSLEMAQDETLGDVARLFTLLKGAAPVCIAQWWEHDPTIPSRSPTTGAGVTRGLEATFHHVDVDATAVTLLRHWITLARRCPPALLPVLRIALDRLTVMPRNDEEAQSIGRLSSAWLLRHYFFAGVARISQSLGSGWRQELLGSLDPHGPSASRSSPASVRCTTLGRKRCTTESYLAR